MQNVSRTLDRGDPAAQDLTEPRALAGRRLVEGTSPSLWSGSCGPRGRAHQRLQCRGRLRCSPGPTATTALLLLPQSSLLSGTHHHPPDCRRHEEVRGRCGCGDLSVTNVDYGRRVRAGSRDPGEARDRRRRLRTSGIEDVDMRDPTQRSAARRWTHGGLVRPPDRDMHHVLAPAGLRRSATLASRETPADRRHERAASGLTDRSPQLVSPHPDVYEMQSPSAGSSESNARVCASTLG
jgi:hypothetical protein